MRALKVLPLALFAVVSFASANDMQKVLATEGPLPLSKVEARKLFQPCSRSAPEPGKTLWFPTAVQIAELESRLPQFLQSLKLEKHLLPSASVQFRGQYVGFMRDGVQYVYASFIPTENVRDFKKGQVAIMCDGGNLFWGVVYNAVTGQFSELKVNGP